MLWVRTEDGSCINLEQCQKVYIDRVYSGGYGVFADNHLLKATDTEEEAKKVLDNISNTLTRVITMPAMVAPVTVGAPGVAKILDPILMEKLRGH